MAGTNLAIQPDLALDKIVTVGDDGSVGNGLGQDTVLPALMERDSNENGSYIKLANGLIIAWDFVTFSSTSWKSGRDVDFPIAFTADPAITLTFKKSNDGYSSTAQVKVLTPTNMTIWQSNNGFSDGGTSVQFWYTAIGF